MARTSKNTPQSKRATKRPATNPTERENQLVSMAFDLVEQRIQEGSASSQELVHFLKLGSTRNALEMEKIHRENQLLEVKAQQIESSKQTEEMYTNALDALKSYRGSDG